MADGSTPGNGSSNPFGNGSGNVGSRGSGGNDFLKNPQGTGPKGGGIDFTKVKVPAQKTGPAVGVGGANPDSIPPGGRLPQNDPKNAQNMTVAGTAQRKPYTLHGPPAPEAAPSAGPSDLPGGSGGGMTAGGMVGEPEL